MSFRISADQISQWFRSTSRDAQGLLSGLVSRLVNATAVVQGFRFPEGDSIRLPGPDGRTQVKVGNQFIPDGGAIWEMSTRYDIERKANEDFDKLPPCDADQANDTYVAVTPHVWAGKTAWGKDKIDTRKWGNVRTIDAVDLEAWLNLAPAVKRWLMEEMGVQVSGLRGVELYWKELAAQYGQPILNPELIIGGRIEAAAKIRASIMVDQRLIAIQGESPEEACEFAAAVIHQTPDDSGVLLRDRTIFADTPEAAESISGLYNDHLIIPTTTDARRRAVAINSPTARIIDPRDRHGPGRQIEPSPILLGTVRRQDCETLLIASGFSRPVAARIAVQSKGSLTALLWGVSLGPDQPLPWTTDQNAVEIVPLLLVGQWDSQNPNDKVIVEKMTLRPYDKAENLASRWAGVDGPMIQRGSIGDWKALDFAWKELAPKLTRDILNRFQEMAFNVLGTADPAIKLPPERRWAAAIYGAVHPCSAQLRSGVITSLIQLALHDNEVPRGFGQRSVDSLVGDLLSGAKLPCADAWCSLAYWLPDLAEASPDSFLKGMEELLKDNDAVSKMFEESGHMGGHSAHTHILWALERLAWPQQYFFRVVHILARFSELDPGGMTSNRPSNTLSDIFLPARPRTNVDDAGRITAIFNLYDKFPEETWKLALSLLRRTTQGGLVMSTAEPRWREDWIAVGANAPPQTRSVQEIADFAQKLLSKMLAWAAASGGRWADMVDVLSDLRHLVPGMIPEIVNQMKVAAGAISNKADREKLSDEIRKVVNRHRQFPNQSWTLPADIIGELESVQSLLQSPDPKDRYKWLFTSWPDVPELPDRKVEDRMAKVRELRNEAITAIIAAEGIKGAFTFAEMVERPDEVGTSLAALSSAKNRDLEVLSIALHKELTQASIPPALGLGLNYILRRYRDEGPEWLERILESYSTKWDLNSYLNLACGLPYKVEIWDRFATWHADLSKRYWQRVPLQFLVEPDRDLRRACKELVGASRLARAVDIARLSRVQRGSDGKTEPVNFDPAVLVQLLRDLRSHDPKKEWFPPSLGSIGPAVDDLLGRLEDVGTDLQTLAGLEWQWFSVIHRPAARASRSLKKIMAESPQWFIEILSLAFRKRGQPAQKPVDENSQQLASNAYLLLHDWDCPPGYVEADDPEKQSSSGAFPFTTGKFDATAFAEWVAAARKLAADVDRAAVADGQIGEVLAHCPQDDDGTWPCLAVRLFLESEDTAEIRKGLVRGMYNRRGVVMVDGGQSGKKLADQFTVMANRIRTQCPHTAGVLDQIASSYLREGRDEAARAKFDEFNAQT